MLIYILIATIIVSLVSLIGIFVVFNNHASQRKLKLLISLAAGTMLGSAFLDLLPEAINHGAFKPITITSTVLLSIVFFFIIERIFHWHHCWCEEHGLPANVEKKHIVYLNVIGDGIHNLIDGFLIAASFMISIKAGMIVTVAVILHEIPQEISDFGVLLYGGLTKFKALIVNLVTALISVFGALAFFYFSSRVDSAIPLMAAIASGVFIYLATADLIPELHHEKDSNRIVIHSILLIAGILFIAGMTFLFP